MPELNLNDLTRRVYKLLSSAYLKPPEVKSLEAIFKWSEGILDQKNSLPENILSIIQDLKNSTSDKLTDEKILPIKEDYVRLIRSPSPDTSPPPPYESVYREGLVWGGATVEVLKKYRECKIEPVGQYHSEPPDHIGLELYFLAELCGKEGKTTDKKDLKELQKKELEFLDKHLTKWFSLYLKRALEYKPHRFYEGIFKLTSEWIKLHVEYLKASCACV